jgi:hypothetical protein
MLAGRALNLDGFLMTVLRGVAADCAHRRRDMTDLIFIATAVGFFLVAIALAHGCEKLRGGSHD